ncbi:MAG: barstar family protein [Oscillospiraceae bacterium]|nr:barstar family protein [Oscillospiraceae bacterium]
MERVIIECGAVKSREDLHAALAKQLHFPAWYGGNLDALHDLLTDISADTRLILADWPAAEAALGDYGRRVEKVLAICALKNPRLTIEFC